MLISDVTKFYFLWQEEKGNLKPEERGPSSELEDNEAEVIIIPWSVFKHNFIGKLHLLRIENLSELANVG